MTYAEKLGPTLRRFTREGYAVKFLPMSHLGRAPSPLYAGRAWLVAENGEKVCTAWVAQPLTLDPDQYVSELIVSMGVALRRELHRL